MHKGFKDYVFGLIANSTPEERQLELEMLTHDPERMTRLVQDKISDWARAYVTKFGGVIIYQRGADADEVMGHYREIFKDELATMV